MGGQTKSERREREIKEKKKVFRFSLRSTKQEVKSIHASRATHGYQNLGVSSNSTR